MIEILFLIIPVAALFLSFYFAWAIKANNITFSQRKHMIDNVPYALLDHLDVVEYEDHLKEVIRFRDPRKLYSQKVQDYFANNWIE